MENGRAESHVERMHLVVEDMTSDARSFDGRRFTGATVGELHGNLCAAVAAVASTVAVLCERAEL